jgi:hypothetical protein
VLLRVSLFLVTGLAIAPSWAVAATLCGQFQPVSSPTLGSVSPTFVLTDPTSGAAVGPAAGAASNISPNPCFYTYTIDAVPPSSWLVNGAAHPIDLAFQDFTGSWMGSPITVSNLVVELSVGGGQVVGLLPSSDGFVHLLLKLQQTSFTVLSGVYALNGGAETFSLQGSSLGGQDAQVIYRYNPTLNTYDMNLSIGSLTGPMSLNGSGIPTLTISNPGEFFCMDCGFDLPQGTFPPTLPEPATALLVMAGVLGLAVARRRRA